MKEKLFKKGLERRLFSVILTLIMAFSLMPSMSMTAKTAKAATPDGNNSDTYHQVTGTDGQVLVPVNSTVTNAIQKGVTLKFIEKNGNACTPVNVDGNYAAITSGLMKIDNGYKYYDNTLYDVYIKLTDVVGAATWEAGVWDTDKGGVIHIKPTTSNLGYVSYNYEVWLIKAGESNTIENRATFPFVGGSCFMAGQGGNPPEYCRPWSTDNNIYITNNAGGNSIKYLSAKTAWSPSLPGALNNIDTIIFGEGTSAEHSIKGGYAADAGSSRNGEMKFGYVLNQSTVTYKDENGTVQGTAANIPDGQILSSMPATLNVAGKHVIGWTATENLKLNDGTSITAGNPITNEQLAKIINYENITLKVSGYEDHTKVVDEAAVSATCTTDGSTEASHCGVCGEIIGVKTTISASGHTYGSEGESRYTCTCGYVDNAKHLAAVKTDAKAEIDAEADGDTSPEVVAAVEEAKAAIDAATDLEDVSDAELKGIKKIAELRNKNILEEVKKAALKEIDNEVGTDTSENVKEAAEAAKAAIEAATTVEAVEIVTDAGIDAIETAKAANKKLRVAKEAAKAAIDAEVDGDTSPEVVAAIEEAKAAIDAAENLDAVSDAELEGIKKIAELKHLNILEEVKKAALKEIENEVGEDASDNVKKAAEAAKAAIEAATTVEEVEAVTDAGIDAIEAAKTANHKLAEAKRAAKRTIDEEVDGDATPEVLAAAEAAKAAIDAATDLKAISNAELEGIAKIAELENKKVLEEVKKAALRVVDFEVGLYTSANVVEAAKAAKLAIEAATTVAEVKAATNNGIDAIEAAKLGKEKTTEGVPTGDASPIALYILLMGLAGAGMLVSKKRRTVR